MAKIYHILESKPVVYTFKVYAKSKAEALRKFYEHGNVEEIGLDPGTGRTSLRVIECGESSDTCSECMEKYSPDNVRDFLCKKCRRKK